MSRQLRRLAAIASITLLTCAALPAFAGSGRDDQGTKTGVLTYLEEWADWVMTLLTWKGWGDDGTTTSDPFVSPPPPTDDGGLDWGDEPTTNGEPPTCADTDPTCLLGDSSPIG